ncbi:DUF475 domain-containing protein, partial [Streptomyces sp. WSLK1-5]|uniref:DUF475 domain-containing protein n=1 Tax=unclassified Streptomyces TaxID=2593676 RepID=UPI0037AA5612
MTGTDFGLDTSALPLRSSGNDLDFVFFNNLQARTALWSTPATTSPAILSNLEISLSFDNAVVNAGILKKMNAFWQKIFLTIGVLIAVFGMRL